MTRKYLVIGASGLVGSRLIAHFGQSAVGTYRSKPLPGLRPLDITDASAVRRLVGEVGPAVVFVTAAYTHVDGCEQDPERSHAVNVAGLRHVAEAAAAAGARLVFMSSDYVFDGSAGPYPVEAEPAPLNVYGRHKLAAERIVAGTAPSYAILRSCNIYGYDADGMNFVMAVYRNAKDGKPMRVPMDQWGNPTYADDLITALVKAGELAESGLFHVAGPDYLERLSWASRTAEALGFDSSFVEGVVTSALGQPARRPLRGGLDSRASLARLGSETRSLDSGLAVVRAKLSL